MWGASPVEKGSRGVEEEQGGWSEEQARSSEHCCVKQLFSYIQPERNKKVSVTHDAVSPPV